MIGYTYLTIGERTVSFTCTQIDVSAPTVTSLQLTPGDYGRTLGIAYNISHSSYAIEKVELILQDYTMAQRDARHAAAQAALPSAIITDLSDSELKITQMVNQQQTIEDVTITTGTVAQLLNGGIYRYQLTATAANGTTTIISSTYRVPCRVEGLAVEPQEIFIRRGESAFVTLIYDPQDADIKTSTAEVDPGIYPHAWPVLVDGVATGEIVAGNSDGICSISFYSTDGAHASQVIVTVGEHPSYPALEIMTKLTPYQINRIQSAASFIVDELDDLGIQVDELETVITTYAEEVTGIRAKLNALVGNCYKIKAATSGTAYDVTFASDLSYPESNASL
ncbi:MAG: hypothetical protein IKD72_00020 [Clostridia bacterium]|nr:hypothetical protein [Clostridia bacterium]